MARGFESKAVQDQQEEAQRARRAAQPAVDPTLARARRNLELARVDLARRSANTTSEIQRHSLALALEEINRQLAALPVSDPLRD